MMKVLKNSATTSMGKISCCVLLWIVAITTISSTSTTMTMAFVIPTTTTTTATQTTTTISSSSSSSTTALFGKKNTDNQYLQNIFYQNQAWKARKLVEEPDFFIKSSIAPYQPEFMWIGCSDSLVAPNVLLQEEPSNVYVTSNVAGTVIENDANMISSLEYAISTLNVKHIIVCGQYQCRAVLAAMDDTTTIPEKPLKFWLQEIQETYKTNKSELDAISDEYDRHCRLVELHTIQQCINVLKYSSIVQQQRKATYETGEPYLSPLIHAMVFDPSTGTLKRLNIPFVEKYSKELSCVYGFPFTEME